MNRVRTDQSNAGGRCMMNRGENWWNCQTQAKSPRWCGVGNDWTFRCWAVGWDGTVIRILSHSAIQVNTVMNRDCCFLSCLVYHTYHWCACICSMCLCVWMHARVHVHVYMCACMQLYAYVCVHTCTMSRVFVCVHVSLGVFLCVINAVFVSASDSPGMGWHK